MSLTLNTICIFNAPNKLGINSQYQAINCLDYYERQRFKRYKNARKKTFLLGRWLLKTALANHLQCSPKAIKIGIMTNGKPYIKQPRRARHLHISLSHAGSLLACGLTSMVHGVDIENIKRAPTDIKQVKKLINPHISAYIQHVLPTTPLTFDTLFTLFWTYLEAQVKLRGSTLYQEKAHFFEKGTLNPLSLEASTPLFAFSSQKIEDYLISFGCSKQQYIQTIRFTTIKNIEKKTIKYDKMK